MYIPTKFGLTNCKKNKNKNELPKMYMYTLTHEGTDFEQLS